MATTDTFTPRLLRRRDVARTLGVSERQVLRWQAAGLLRPIRVLDLRAVRYLPDDVDALADRIIAAGREATA